jgi:hypothetical protein
VVSIRDIEASKRAEIVSTNAQWFEAPVENPFGLSATYGLASPTHADLDDDGDFDLLVGQYGSLAYFENTGSADIALFTDPVLNPFGIDSSNYYSLPSFVDIDNDGDFDLFIGASFYDYSSYAYSNSLFFQENIGTASLPNFASPIENPFGIDSLERLPFASFVDLDDDGDFDMLVGTSKTMDVYDVYEGTFQYFENIGSATEADFADVIDNPFGLIPTLIVAIPTFSDLDDDGDFDLLTGEFYGALKYFENTGTALAPEFDAPLTNPFGLDSLYGVSIPIFIDLDNDGDFDILSGDYDANFQYFENVNTVGINKINPQINISLYPNPVSDVLNIRTEEIIDKIEIIDVLGKISLQLSNPSNSFSIVDLSSGLYTVKVFFQNGNYATKKILKE